MNYTFDHQTKYSALLMELEENDKAYLARYIHEIEPRYLLRGLLGDNYRDHFSFNEYKRGIALFGLGCDLWVGNIENMIFELYHYSHTYVPFLIVPFEQFWDYVYGK